MPSYFLYAPESGQGIGIFSGQEEDAALQGFPYVGCHQDVTDVTHYVAGGAVLPKQVLSYQTDVTGLTCTITGLPPGLQVDVLGQSLTTDEDAVEIDFDIPGTYTLTMHGGVRYLNEELEVVIHG